MQISGYDWCEKIVVDDWLQPDNNLLHEQSRRQSYWGSSKTFVVKLINNNKYIIFLKKWFMWLLGTRRYVFHVLS